MGELDQKQAAAGSSSMGGTVSGDGVIRKGNLVWRKKKKVVIGHKERVYTLAELLGIALAVWIGLLLLFLLWWSPHWGMTAGAAGMGLFFGFLYSFLYFTNLRQKDEVQQLVSS
jgi:hypothetical protein